MLLLSIYWALTTIYGVYWLIKNPSSRHGDDDTHFTLLEVVGYILPAGLLAWAIVPMMLLSKVEFKR
jgi:hypothetical protein